MFEIQLPHGDGRLELKAIEGVVFDDSIMEVIEKIRGCEIVDGQIQ